MAISLTSTACSETRTPTADGGASANGASTTVAASTADCAEDLMACARRSTIADLVPDAPVKASGEPIELGMINQENTPAGSFPELSQADLAGIEFINQELGGVGGRPLHLEVCNTKFSAEGSTTCGQRFVQSGVDAVLGGIDVFGNGVDVLADNAIPYVGGIPISNQSVQSPASFQWSGGIWGASIAFATYAARTVKAERVAIVYGEFGPITDGANYGKRTLEKLGVTDVQMVPYPVTATDLSSPMQAAASTKPDAIFMLVADAGCKGAFDAVRTMAITAQMFYTGACAAPSIVAQVSPEQTEGAIFNVEQEINRATPNPDMALYTAIVNKYGKGLDPVGAGTVSFRSLMNLYMILDGLDSITPKAISAALEQQVESPSFLGHDYTCDGEQLAGLPAMCSPQQMLAQMHDRNLDQVGTWIDVGKEYGTG